MRTLSKIDTIVLHCSDSNIKSHDDISVIDAWHKDRGFRWEDGVRSGAVGYHYFIQSDGNIQYGRPLNITGAHVRGHNHHTIGICLHGKSDKDFTFYQFLSAGNLVNALKKALGPLEVVGHCDLDPENKAHCPGFDVEKFKQEYT